MNTVESPVIDIVMATHNGARYVEEQIASLQVQSFRDWRLLVSDDCSTDNTVAIINEAAAVDSRIIVISDQVRFGGAKENFMWLIGQASAPYVMLCDQDDVWLPDKIELTYALMREIEMQHATAVPLLVFGDMVVVDSQLEVVDESFCRYSHINPRRTKFRQLLAQSVGAGCTMMINRALIDLLQQSSLCVDAMIMHDWWITLIAAAFGDIAYVKVPVSLYRQHDDNKIGALRYSPIERIKDYGTMAKNIEKTIEQAQVFIKCYEQQMKYEDIYSAEYYCEMKDASLTDRYLNLFRSGCWKYGLRKLGQIIVIPGLSK